MSRPKSIYAFLVVVRVLIVLVLVRLHDASGVIS